MFKIYIIFHFILKHGHFSYRPQTQPLAFSLLSRFFASLRLITECPGATLTFKTSLTYYFSFFVLAIPS